MILSDLHSYNSLFCFLLGTSLNLLLIWLVVRKAPKEMQTCKFMLLLASIFDIFLSASFELTQPIFLVHNGYMIIIMNGHFVSSINSASIRCIIFNLWMFAYYFSIFQLCVQFVYRYLILVREVHGISSLQYLLILTIPFVSDVIICVLLFLSSAPDANTSEIYDEQLAEWLLPDKNMPILTAIVALSRDPFFLLSLGSIALANTLCYIPIVYCGYAMAHHVKTFTKMTAQEKRTQDLNKQLLRNLILQATMPLMLVCLNMSLAMLAMFSSNSSPTLLFIEMLSMMQMHYLPVFNPMITILTVKPFRRALIPRRWQSKRLLAVTQVRTAVNSGLAGRKI